MCSAADAFGKARRRKTLQAPIAQECRVHERLRRHVTRRVVHVVAGSTVHVRHPSELAFEIIGLLEHRAVDSDLRTAHRQGVSEGGWEAVSRGRPAAVRAGRVYLGPSSGRTSLRLKQRDEELLVCCHTKEGRAREPAALTNMGQGGGASP